MQRCRWSVWSVYVGWRAPAWGLLSGLPLSPLAIVAILIIWWTWWVRRELPAARWLTALLALKIAVGLAVVPHGFSGAYFSNDSWSGPPERGLFSPGPAETRIDEALAFGAPNPDLPLFYLNDLRFNSDPHRDLLGYSAHWSGFLAPDANTTATFYLTGRGVSGEVTVDGFQCLVKRAEDDESRGSVDLRRGIRHVEVRVAGACTAHHGRSRWDWSIRGPTPGLGSVDPKSSPGGCPSGGTR